MAIIWCGGEDVDFPNGNAVTSSDTFATYHRTVSRVAIAGASGIGKSKTFSPVTSGWLSARVYASGDPQNFKSFGLGSSVADSGIFFGWASPSSKMAIWKRSAGVYTKLAEEAGTSFTYGAIHNPILRLDDLGPAARVRLYSPTGALVVDWTGDLTLSGAAALDQVWLLWNGTGHKYSEIIVTDKDPRRASLRTLAPDGAGDANTFTAGGYAEIDETTASDADVAVAGDYEQDLQVNLTGMPAGTFSVKAVKFTDRMSGTEGAGMQTGVKTNGSLSLGATIPLDLAWQSYEQMYETNPVTGLAWTPAEVEVLQRAFRSKAV